MYSIVVLATIGRATVATCARTEEGVPVDVSGFRGGGGRKKSVQLLTFHGWRGRWSRLVKTLACRERCLLFLEKLMVAMAKAGVEAGKHGRSRIRL